MVVVWKERDHDIIDALDIEDEGCMDALRDCGLKKFFLTSSMRVQPELLQFIIDRQGMNQKMMSYGVVTILIQKQPKQQEVLLPYFFLMCIMKPYHTNGHMKCHIIPIKRFIINAHHESIMPKFVQYKTHRHRRCHVVANISQVKPK